MPSKVHDCWSCVLLRGVKKANRAVDKPNKNQLAHGLGLCHSCLECRRCDKHGSEPRIFVDDMPLQLRSKCKSEHTPDGLTVSHGVMLCTVCDNLIAVPCTECLDEKEVALRRSGVLRCSSCADLDLIVLGKPILDKGR